MPKAGAWVSLTFEDDLLAIKDLHLEFVESGFKVVVTELTDRDKGAVVEIREKVGLTSGNWEMGHVEESCVSCFDDGSIGKFDLDAVICWAALDTVAMNFEKMACASRVEECRMVWIAGVRVGSL